MKSVLISIQPKWIEKIASGQKTIEVRKTKPKLETPFKCYIYATRPKKWFRFSSWGYASDENLWLSNGKVKMCDGFEFWADGIEYEPLCGKVIGEFVCDRIEEVYQCNSGWVKENACISQDEFFDYLGIPRGTHFGYDKKAYGWRISDLKIYDKPKELGEFYVATPKPMSKWTDKDMCHHCKYHKWIGSMEQFVKKGIPMREKCMLKKPEPICEYTPPIERPPQSWCYVEE